MSVCLFLVSIQIQLQTCQCSKSKQIAFQNQVNVAIDEAIGDLRQVYSDDRIYLDDLDIAFTSLFRTMARMGDVQVSKMADGNGTEISFLLTSGPLDAIVGANYGRSHVVNDTIKLVVADLRLRYEADEMVLKMARFPMVTQLDTISYLDQFRVDIKRKAAFCLNGNFLLELSHFDALLMLLQMQYLSSNVIDPIN